jgi:hypothetical protein
MINKLSFLIIATCFSVTASATQLEFPYVPEQKMTPGDFCTRQDPDYLGDAYPEKIAKCERDVIYNTKQKIYELYSVKKSCQVNYTIDHFIPLSIGGSNSIENLWPEHKSIKALRQNLELNLFQDLRDGKISQAEAVRKIRQAKINPPVTKPMNLCH